MKQFQILCWLYLSINNRVTYQADESLRVARLSSPHLREHCDETLFAETHGWVGVCVCVCVWVSVSEREREREREKKKCQRLRRFFCNVIDSYSVCGKPGVSKHCINTHRPIHFMNILTSSPTSAPYPAAMVSVNHCLNREPKKNELPLTRHTQRGFYFGEG